MLRGKYADKHNGIRMLASGPITPEISNALAALKNCTATDPEAEMIMEQAVRKLLIAALENAALQRPPAMGA